MRMITAAELRKLPREQNLIVPFNAENLTPVGLDLTLGGIAINTTAGERVELEKGEVLEIQHDDRVHVVTRERITMPSNWFGMIFAKVSLARQGLTPLGTKIDPGYEGNLLLTFTNKANRVVRLRNGDRICNVAFFEIPEPGLLYEPQALKLITERIEPPISFRYQLGEADIEKLSHFYSRGMIDFYLAMLDHFRSSPELPVKSAA